jgi:hypothetical protein
MMVIEGGNKYAERKYEEHTPGPSQEGNTTFWMPVVQLVQF